VSNRSSPKNSSPSKDQIKKMMNRTEL